MTGALDVTRTAIPTPAPRSAPRIAPDAPGRDASPEQHERSA